MHPFAMLWNGTGNTVNLDRGHTSFTIRGAGEGRLLIDCGGSVPMRLVRTGELRNITGVALSHLHADHIGGLETLGFRSYYSHGRRTADKLKLYVATDEFAHRLWEHTLKGGMEPIVDEERRPQKGSLEMFFDVHVGKVVKEDGFPPVEFVPTVHIAGMENYGFMIDKRVHFSGDTIEKLSLKADVIFHDCEFRDPNMMGVHIAYEELLEAIAKKDRARVYLTHLEPGATAQRPLEDGFAGLVDPFQHFQFDDTA